MKVSLSHRKLRRFWWLSPRSFDVVSSLLYLGVLVANIYNPCQRTYQEIVTAPLRPAFNTSCSPGAWNTISLACCVAILLLIDRWEYWSYGEETPRKMALILLASRTLLIAYAVLLSRLNFSPFFYLFLPFLACLYFGSKAGYVMTGLAWLAYVITHFLWQPNWYLYSTPINNFIIFTIGLVFAMIMSITVLNERAGRKRTEQLLAELEDSHQQLQSYAAQVEDLATTKERNRLARDIHDTLGHYLTIINVQLEKALVFREQKPDVAEQSVHDAKRMASEALQDVRRSVGMLRSTQAVFSFETAMQELIERMRGGEFAVDLHIEGYEASYSASSLIVLYHAAQEGLTNVQRHARAHLAQVWVNFGANAVILTVRDDGCGFDTANLYGPQGAHKSYGLLGMQERLELVGGYLEIKSNPSEGTRLLINVPKEPLL